MLDNDHTIGLKFINNTWYMLFFLCHFTVFFVIELSVVSASICGF